MPTISIPPTDDAFVTENSNSGNGVSSMIELNKQSEFETRGMMRFDLSSISNNAIIQSARIRVSDVITALCPNPIVNVHRLLNDSWDENTVNGNNRPDFNPELTTFLDNFPNTIEYDVTTDVAREFSFNKIFSWIFMIGNPISCFVSFSSKDHTELPARMEITFSEAEPSQLPLILGIGAIVIAGMYFLLKK